MLVQGGCFGWFGVLSGSEGRWKRAMERGCPWRDLQFNLRAQQTIAQDHV